MEGARKMELLRKKVNYTDKNGKEKTVYNFYLKLDSGHFVAIKNTFKEGYLPLVFASVDKKEVK